MPGTSIARGATLIGCSPLVAVTPRRAPRYFVPVPELRVSFPFFPCRRRFQSRLRLPAAEKDGTLSSLLLFVYFIIIVKGENLVKEKMEKQQEQGSFFRLPC